MRQKPISEAKENHATTHQDRAASAGAGFEIQQRADLPVHQQVHGTRKEGAGRAHRCTTRSTIIQERTGRGPLEVFEQACHNATPFLEVKPRRVGGATYQVPVQIEGRRRQIAGDSLVAHVRAQPLRQVDGPRNSPTRLLDASTDRARRSSAARTRTAWPRQTAPLPTIATSVSVARREAPFDTRESTMSGTDPHGNRVHEYGNLASQPTR